jgi:hypothetical protein
METLIIWTDAVIDAAFRTVGYVIPFAAISGESWAASQTNLIAYLSAIGAAAMCGGWILRPAPSLGPITGNAASGNVFAEMFERMKSDVYKGGLGIRASYQLQSKAEKWCAEPYGPRMDFLEDYFDPTRNQMLIEYTNMIMDAHEEITDLDLDFDYLFSLRATTAD